MANTRSGANSGPCRARITASTSDTTTMNTWATSQIRTFSQKPRRTSGNEARMSSHEKNWRRTAGQYSDRLISQATSAEHDDRAAPRSPRGRASAGAPPERAGVVTYRLRPLARGTPRLTR